jgi:hypothetical protein
MTRVLNLRTGDEIHYTLPPKKAVTAAFEQNKGNYNTWTYNLDNHPEIRETNKFFFCGDFGASKVQS